MFLVSNIYVRILWFALMQNVVFASMCDGKKTMDPSSELIFSYLQLPWMNGIHWLEHSTESPDLKEVRAFVRGIESRKTSALQMLDDLLKYQREIRKTKLQGTEMSDDCTEDNAQHIDTNSQSDRCQASFSFVSLILNRSNEFSSLTCEATSNGTETAGYVRNVIGSDLVTNEFGDEASTAPGPRVEYEKFASEEIYAIIFFATVCAFIFVCTICDLSKRYGPGSTSFIVYTLAKFSLFTNALSLLSTNVTPQTMPAIHGLRCLSSISIIIGHRYFATLLIMREKINLLDILEWKSSRVSLYNQLTPFAVDTFSVISGFLMTYLFLKSMKSGTKFNLLTMYLHRYCRLTPCLAALMLFVATLLHRAANDPSWESSIPFVVNPCRENWWTNLLFIQNFTSKASMCLPHLWTLAVDMQLFWMSPIILYPLHHWPKFGLRLLSLLLVASMVTPSILVAINGYSHATLRIDMNLSRIADDFSHYYISPFNRAFPYLIGILLGYDVVVNRRRLTQMNVMTNWIVAGGLVLFCTWAVHRVNNSNFAYDLAFESAFPLLVRPFWSIAIAWTIYACTQGYGGLATRFLALPLFLPLSRLSYCIYLVHVLIQTNLIASSSTPTTNFVSDVFHGVWSDLIFSTVVAFVLSLLFETPIIVLEKFLKNRLSRSNQADADIVVQNSHRKVKPKFKKF